MAEPPGKYGSKDMRVLVTGHRGYIGVSTGSRRPVTKLSASTQNSTRTAPSG